MWNFSRRKEFERLFVPHLDAAFNLACWLVRHPQDAEDLVQEAYIKAYKAFNQFHGSQPKAWFMAIVRNTCLSWLKRQSNKTKIVDFNEALVQRNLQSGHPNTASPLPDPETAILANAEKMRIREALHQLPEHLRVVMVLREFEDMSYKEIALVVKAPVGTVMSRISRARKKLRSLLQKPKHGGQKNEL